jgi:hypothetical protein
MVAYSMVKEDMLEPAQSLGGVRPAGFTLRPSDTPAEAAAAPQPHPGFSFPLPPKLATNAEQQERQQQRQKLLYQISTPNGMTKVQLTEQELRRQEHGFRCATKRMNHGEWMGVGKYIELFGLIDPLMNHGWGSDIWSGIGKLHSKYLHSDKLCGKLMFGWFIIPTPFSKDHARLHPEGDQTASQGLFPAVFAFDARFPDADVPMACLHILLQNGPVWIVNFHRMIAVKEL